MAILPPNEKGFKIAGQVIVNADDFGLTESVNDGVIACHQAGIVRSTSVLANGDGLRDALEKSSDHPGLGLGIHLTLVFGKPVAPPEKVRSLIFKKGSLAAGYPKFAQRYFLGGIKSSEVEYEWEAQREKLAGIKIDHLDSHQHLHLLPGLFKLVVKLAQKWGIPYVRVPSENLKINLPAATHSGKVLNLYTLGKKRLLANSGLKTTDSFFGSSFSGAMTADVWPKLWPRIPAGITEIMCHPGLENEQARALYGWANKWEDEYRALTDPQTLIQGRDSGVAFTNFTEISQR
ncbi:MAG: ChbG/HpnK family deacetylase [FCB group bacterium]|nr:ChbG/HpnK family deacetylase [FCB group bacterium]